MNRTLKIPTHTLLGQRAINPAHKQQHGRRVLRATFYTIQRRYASYCLVPSCLTGTRPESCTNTLGELQVISLPALASSAQPSAERKLRLTAGPGSRSWRGSAAPRVPARFPARAGFPRQLRELTPTLLGSGEATLQEGAGCCLVQQRVMKGHGSLQHKANLQEQRVSLASAVPGCPPEPSRPQEGLELADPTILWNHRVIKPGKDL